MAAVSNFLLGHSARLTRVIVYEERENSIRVSGLWRRGGTWSTVALLHEFSIEEGETEVVSSILCPTMLVITVWRTIYPL